MDGSRDELEALTAAIRGCRICAGVFAATRTAHAPRLVCGQAPGRKVHERGRPFDDASGDRLRDWLSVDRETFYDRRRFAVLPMAFCFPGYGANAADLPPPPVCARTWRTRALAAMPEVRLTLLVGGHAQAWHLGPGLVTDTVRNWRAAGPAVIPLPHPSWRNTGWLKRNPWFEAELVPELRRRVRLLLEEVDGTPA